MNQKTKRVFHIAKELNISHIEILNFLSQKEIDVKTHMSPVSTEIYDLILGEFSKEKKDIERFRKEQARKAVVTNIKKSKDAQSEEEEAENNIEQPKEVDNDDIPKVLDGKSANKIGLKIVKEATEADKVEKHVDSKEYESEINKKKGDESPFIYMLNFLIV